MVCPKGRSRALGLSGLLRLLIIGLIVFFVSYDGNSVRDDRWPHSTPPSCQAAITNDNHGGPTDCDRLASYITCPEDVPVVAFLTDEEDDELMASLAAIQLVLAPIFTTAYAPIIVSPLPARY